MKNVIKILISIWFFAIVANAQFEIVGNIREDKSVFGQKIKTGKILIIDFNDLGERIRYLFKNGDKLILLNDDPSAVAKMIIEELKISNDPNSYFFENIVTIVEYCLLPRKSTILNESFLERVEKTSGILNDQPELQAKEKKELESIRNNFTANNSIVILDNSWKVVLFVGINDGSARKYIIEGGMLPFQIEKFESIEVAKSATFTCFQQF